MCKVKNCSKPTNSRGQNQSLFEVTDSAKEYEVQVHTSVQFKKSIFCCISNGMTMQEVSQSTLEKCSSELGEEGGERLHNF